MKTSKFLDDMKTYYRNQNSRFHHDRRDDLYTMDEYEREERVRNLDFLRRVIKRVEDSHVSQEAKTIKTPWEGF